MSCRRGDRSCVRMYKMYECISKKNITVDPEVRRNQKDARWLMQASFNKKPVIFKKKKTLKNEV